MDTINTLIKPHLERLSYSLAENYLSHLTVIVFERMKIFAFFSFTIFVHV